MFKEKAVAASSELALFGIVMNLGCFVVVVNRQAAPPPPSLLRAGPLPCPLPIGWGENSPKEFALWTLELKRLT